MRVKTEYEKEAQMTGHLRNLYRGGNNIFSEETRLVRKLGENQKPIIAAVTGELTMRAKNDHLANLYVENGLLARKIIRPNINTRFRNASIPNSQSVWAKILKNVPNSYTGRRSDRVPLEDQHWRYLDQFGHAGANPEKGRSYVWPNYLYYGNPWGAGGQLYSHFRQGGQQDDKYLWPAKNNTHFLK